MLDGWTTAGSGGDTNNVNFTPLGNTNGDATRGFIREEGNQMTFVHGSSQLIHGEDHGFSFPKTGLYVIEGNFKIRMDWSKTSGHSYLQCHMTKNNGVSWDGIGQGSGFRVQGLGFRV